MGSRHLLHRRRDERIPRFRCLVEHRGLGQIATVGFSQGAPFAFALAGSGAAHAVAIAAGQDDMLSVRHLLHPDVVAMVDAAAHDPARFERGIAETASAKWLWRTINDMIAERDRKLYNAGRFARRLPPLSRRGLQTRF